MKKALVLLLALAMVLSLAACGSAPAATPAEEPAAGDDALRRLLSDPAQLAADLEALTHALQELSETLRRSAGDARKEDRR